jgi:speckle-type POZ protein
MILCTKSEYFMNLCGPGKQFAEADQGAVELKEDDEEAVAAMLRFIYSFDYESSESKAMPDQFVFHVNVCVVADKCGLDKLRHETLKRTIVFVETAHDAALINVVRQLQESDVAAPEEIVKVVHQVRDDRLPQLMQSDDFRIVLERDSTSCMAIIDKLLKDGPPMPGTSAASL